MSEDPTDDLTELLCRAYTVIDQLLDHEGVEDRESMVVLRELGDALRARGVAEWEASDWEAEPEADGADARG